MGLTVSKSNRACSNFPNYSWSSYEYFINFQSVDFCAYQFVMYFPPIILTIELRMGIIFWACSFNILKTNLFWISVIGGTPNHIPHKYRYPNKKSIRIRVRLDLKSDAGMLASSSYQST